MKSSGIIFWLAVLVVFSGGMTAYLAYRMMSPPTPEPGGETVRTSVYDMPAGAEDHLTEFTLTDRSGETFDSASLEGEVYVVNFFFANCPAECAQMNRKVQELQREFGGEGVRFVSITCDPLHDTPSVLAEYAQRFNADPEKWYFLTGNQEYIGRIGDEIFHVPVYDSKMRPMHTNHLIVVDRAGTPHYFTWNDPAEFAKLKTALDEFVAQTVEEAQANFEQGDGVDAAQEVEEQPAEKTEEQSAEPSDDQSTEETITTPPEAGVAEEAAAEEVAAPAAETETEPAPAPAG